MNYYKILGVEETTPFVDIKNAYRALRSKHHPDKGGDALKFAEILTAYEWILENPYVAPVKSSYQKPFVSSLDDSYLNKYKNEDVIMPKVYTETNELGFAGYLPDGTAVYKISLAQAYTGAKLKLIIPNYKSVTYELTPLTNNLSTKITLEGDVSWLAGTYHTIKILFKIAQHDFYHLENADLFCSVTTSLFDLLNRTPLKFQHPDGRNSLTIPIPYNYHLGDTIRIPEHGFEFLQYGVLNRGDIIVSALAKLPYLDEKSIKDINKILNDI